MSKVGVVGVGMGYSGGGDKESMATFVYIGWYEKKKKETYFDPEFSL